MNNLIVGTAVALSLASVTAFGQAQVTDSTKAPQSSVVSVPQAQSPGDVLRNGLTELKSDLNSSYQEYTGKDSKVVESYLSALARIEVAFQYVLANFKPGEPVSLALRTKERKARDMFAACSLLAELAITQMAKDRLDSELALVALSRDSVTAQLAQVYRSIIDLERGRASDLKGKLDAENAKTREMQKEMERRFKELESALIKVRKDARGTIVSMSDILFGFDKADITTDLKTSLAKIAGILTVYKDCKVIVEGHTDNIGTADYNQNLSERRAVNVKGFLVEQGLATVRLSAVGYGMSRPYASNSTKEGRQKNRRVDLVIVEK